MAPFNKRQIGYIQAIAGRQQHRTLISGQHDVQIRSDDTVELKKQPQTLSGQLVQGCGMGGNHPNAKSLLLYNWLLDQAESGFDSRPHHSDDKLENLDFSNLSSTDVACGNTKEFSLFNAAAEGTYGLSAPGGGAGHVEDNLSAEGHLQANPQLLSSQVRATVDGYLNSTHLTFRFTLPRQIPIQPGTTGNNESDNHNPMGQDHYEFRWIVWRSKRPTMPKECNVAGKTNLEAVRDGCSLRNPGYDFFMGQTGRKRGLLGYTLNKDLDKEKIVNSPDGEAYSGQHWNGTAFTTAFVPHTHYWDNNQEDALTVDDLLTMRINREDYVVMKDVRFFLGKEHGKSHFEDTLHWDWNDPIDTPLDNVLTSPTLNDKNYRWHMTLIGTSGGKSRCALNVCARWTTKMESG